MTTTCLIGVCVAASANEPVLAAKVGAVPMLSIVVAERRASVVLHDRSGMFFILPLEKMVPSMNSAANVDASRRLLRREHWRL
jgi:hypothetical protein